MKWLGIGPGRCGTQSLAKIFGATHESHRLPWKMTLATMRSADTMMATPQPLVGWTYLSHVFYMRAQWIDLPIVNMRRDKESCVDSHMRICAGSDRLSVQGRMSLRPYGFNEAYPYCPNVLPGRPAWEHWWDIANHIMDSLHGPVYDLWLDDLNDQDKLNHLRTWLASHGVVFKPGMYIAPAHIDGSGAVVK